MKINPLNLIDWYKADHRRQYPEGTSLIFSNFTPRKSRVEGVDHIVFFGLQYFIKEYLIKQWNENFFERPKEEVIAEYRESVESSLGVDAITYEHVEALHDLGYLPLCIMALPEGVRVPIDVPPLVIFNTEPEFFWLVNYLETIISAILWMPCTSATTAYEYRKLFEEGAKATMPIMTNSMNSIPSFQGHDFSFRGMPGLEAALMSSAGHALSFSGGDTVPVKHFLAEYYNTPLGSLPIALSIPATEHSVMCMGTQKDELETFENLITKVYPKGYVSIVSDTWNFWKVMTEYLPALKDKILARDGKVVIRPDSGNPVDIICGTFQPHHADFEDREYPEEKGAIELLWEIFGGTVNSKGFKELDPHIGLIYGDSITLERARQINNRLKAKGFATTNWVAGIGSYTYQFVTRDTYGFAMKATYGEIIHTPKSVCYEKGICMEEEAIVAEMGEQYRGIDICKDGCVQECAIKETREIFKDPKTDDGTKKSAKGLLAVFKDAKGRYFLMDRAKWADVANCEFQKVFFEGELLINYSFQEIRENLNKELWK